MTTITIENLSGMNQTYTICSEKPQISGNPQSKVWQVVMFSTFAPQDGRGQCSVHPRYSAFAGSLRGSAQPGVPVTASNMIPVTLGQTTLSFSIQEGYPQLSPPSRNSNAPVNSFQINTDRTVDNRTVMSQNIVVGVAGSANGNSVPAACFMPGPNAQYSIEPINKYYVICGGRLTVGSTIDTNEIPEGTKVLIQSQGSVNIKHQPDGRLVVS